MCIGEDGARYKTQALEPDLAMELVKMHVQHDHAGPVHAGDGQQQVRSMVETTIVHTTTLF